jgi:hypothetical protein
MDEMKRAEIDEALRAVAKQRDGLLGMAPALSPARRAVLTGCLVKEFRVEAALREAAKRRDQLLGSCPTEIPSSVESALRRQLLAAEPAGDGTRMRHASDWTINASIWRKIFRSPLRAVLTACAVIAMAFLCVGRWGSPTPRVAVEDRPAAARENLQPGAVLDRAWLGRAELFSRRLAIGPFNLNTNEPASLQTSFAAHSRIQSADGIETPLGLRLDLPLSASLLEDGLARTP